MRNEVKRNENLVISDYAKYNHESRYKTYYKIVDLNTNDSYLETANNFNLSETTANKYHVVEYVEEGRLDMIAQIYYGDPSLYWVIAMANNIIDPLTVIQGTILKIPEFDNLYFSGGPLVRRR